MKYHIQTYGCQANKADSTRIATVLADMGHTPTSDIDKADIIVLNTCSVRQSAEDRVYSRLDKLQLLKQSKPHLKVVVAGCMVGPHASSPRDSAITSRLVGVDQLIGTQDYSRLYQILRELAPTTQEYLSRPLAYSKNKYDQGFVLISSGCNNFCTFCVVPYARGKEISRPVSEILDEVRTLVSRGIRHITLLGQNVNSYGADLVLGKPLGGDRTQINELRLRRKNLRATRMQSTKVTKLDTTSTDPFVAGPFSDIQSLTTASNQTNEFTLPSGRSVKPIQVKHLGKIRVPTLFPFLLEEIAQIPDVETLSFMSSNPWDFSDELIDIIAKYPNIDRHLHLPVQSGDNNVLRRMNRWYTREEYLKLIGKIKAQVPNVTFGTDIIVGFPDESDEEFQNTFALCQQVGFKNAFIAEYSIRPGTPASLMKDNITNPIKKHRFHLLDTLINGIIHN